MLSSLLQAKNAFSGMLVILFLNAEFNLQMQQNSD